MNDTRKEANDPQADPLMDRRRPPAETMITLDQYQAEAERTAGEHDLTLYGPMGLAGESGEVIDYVKKVKFHGFKLDKEVLREELGDALWYLAMTARGYGIDLSSVAAANVEKLRRRYPDGFDAERSRNRGT